MKGTVHLAAARLSSLPESNSASEMIAAIPPLAPGSHLVENCLSKSLTLSQLVSFSLGQPLERRVREEDRGGEGYLEQEKGQEGFCSLPKRSEPQSLRIPLYKLGGLRPWPTKGCHAFGTDHPSSGP